MQISLTEAKAKLTDLVRRAEAGEEIVLTRHGKPAVRLQAATERTLDEMTVEERLAWLEDISRRAAAKAIPGPSAARAADFLYDERGLPE